MKLFYEMIYRSFRAPWDIGGREELVGFVDSGRIKPGRAIAAATLAADPVPGNCLPGCFPHFTEA